MTNGMVKWAMPEPVLEVGNWGLFNILNTRANAAEFWYTDRLPGESRRRR